jgi:uncharacterized coiled-coil protein SlyX
MAKTAAKETSLPVVVSLVFFVLTTIGLGVFVYVLYSDQEAKDAEVAKAKDEVKNLRNEAKDKDLIARALRVAVGVGDADDLSTLQGDVKEGDKVHLEIKRLADAVKKKGPELTKSQADRFNAAVKAYAMNPDAKPLEAAVAPGEFDAWAGDFDSQLKAPLPDKTFLGLVARARGQRELALNQLAADNASYADALGKLEAAQVAAKQVKELFAAKAISLPKEFKDKMDELENTLNTKTKLYTTDTTALRAQFAEQTTALEKANDALRRQKSDNDELREQIRILLAKVKPPDPLQYEEPQGRVIRRPDANIVEIDLGSSSLVTPGLTFSVLPMDFPEKGKQSRLREFRDPDERGVMKTRVEFVPKGTIEVIEVLGPGLSRARITSETDSIRDRILDGDLIYNPVWRRGVGEHVALIGVFDINGDGTDDIEAVERDLRKMGVTLDAVFDLRKGEWRGRLTDRTRYVVEGYQIPVTANDPHQAAKAVLIGKMAAARQEAVGKAIPIINFREFFGRTGYRVNPNVSEAQISRAVSRYFAAVGTDPMPMEPKN